MAKDQLERFRHAVDADASGEALEDAVRAVEAHGAAFHGEALASAPRGYPRDHPRVVHLRRKALVAGKRLGTGPKLYDRRALKFALDTWAGLSPLESWLDVHVGPSVIPPEIRFGGRRTPRPASV